MARPVSSTVLAAGALALAVSVPAGAQTADSAQTAGYHVSAAADAGGDGSRARPFRTLAEAEAATASGDTIYLLASDTRLDGGITLKPRQKLLGLDPDGRLATAPEHRVRLTSTEAPPGGVIVTLADHNEVAGLHFVDIANHAIAGHDTDFSGAFIHHTTFTGHADVHVEDERGQVYAVSLDASEGVRDGVRIEDSRFHDGEDLGAIRVFHSGDSRGRYRFRGNEFADLGGRAYFVRTQHTSRVETIILDSVAANIGRGDRNADSIIPYLMGRSQQVMLVRNYRFDNPNQEGNQSNTAIEGYLFGSPRPDEANWCDGCRLTLTIEDSVLRNSVTDSIQFSDAGRRSVVVYEVRNTRILGGNPRQGGGGISLNLGEPGGGGSTTLLVENTDVIGTTGYGVAVNNRHGGTHDLTVDLGGGPLGSRGGNRFLDNAKGAMRVSPGRVFARHNWWGRGAPVIVGPDDQVLDASEVVWEPARAAAPR